MAKAWLELIRDPAHVFNLASGENLLGRRDEDVHPAIDLTALDTDSKVSRSHALLEWKEGKVLLTDLESTNGTYGGDGARLKPRKQYRVMDNDEVIFGALRFRIRIILGES